MVESLPLGLHPLARGLLLKDCLRITVGGLGAPEHVLAHKRTCTHKHRRSLARHGTVKARESEPLSGRLKVRAGMAPHVMLIFAPP